MSQWMDRKLSRRALAMVLCICMVLALVPAPVYAECTHHPEHTAECGYVAGEDGQPCSFVCSICAAEAKEASTVGEPAESSTGEGAPAESSTGEGAPAEGSTGEGSPAESSTGEGSPAEGSTEE